MVSPMRLIKFTHACVRLEDGDRRLLIDPGIWTEREAYEGVTDILVTHEHDDHIDIERIRSLLTSQELRIFAPQAVQALVMEDNVGAAAAAAITSVAAGDTFTAGGFEVTTVGGKHAEIYENLPGCANVGFIVEGAPARAFPIHDRMLSTDIGFDYIDAWMQAKGNTDYARIPLGDAATV